MVVKLNTNPEAPERLPLWHWAPKDHAYYGFGELSSLIVVYTEPLGNVPTAEQDLHAIADREPQFRV